MKEKQLPTFFEDKLVRGLLIVSLVLVAVQWVIWGFFISKDGQVVLHYNVYFGSDSVGEWIDLIAMPIVGSAMLALNFGLARAILKANQFASFLLSFGTIFVEAFILLSLIMLYVINR